ncbi:MAG: DUF3306 domain-containing protein [Burkholderiaceae bacterium]
MSEVNQKDIDNQREGESFFQRFSRRKVEARQEEEKLNAVAVEEVVQEPELTDEDMPPLESLNEDSDYSGFMSSKVSETLRKAALRKLFHSPQFNVISELDEYAEDFTKFELLGDIVTSDMKHQIEVEARRAAEKLKESLALDDEDDVENEESLSLDEQEQPLALDHSDGTEVKAIEEKEIHHDR